MVCQVIWGPGCITSSPFSLHFPPLSTQAMVSHCSSKRGLSKQNFLPPPSLREFSFSLYNCHFYKILPEQKSLMKNLLITELESRGSKDSSRAPWHGSSFSLHFWQESCHLYVLSVGWVILHSFTQMMKDYQISETNTAWALMSQKWGSQCVLSGPNRGVSSPKNSEKQWIEISLVPWEDSRSMGCSSGTFQLSRVLNRVSTDRDK